MQAEEYARMYAYENHYWWFVGRRRLVGELIGAFVDLGTGWVLDAGCGTGAMLSELSRTAPAVGVDIEASALHYARQRGDFPLIRARLEALPFVNESFRLIVALDVLEHLPDEAHALAELWRVLEPDGWLITTVPAYRWLWSKHDVALHHYRRYTACHLRERLQSAGFTVCKLSYSVMFLFLPIALVRWWDRWHSAPPTATLVPVAPWLNRWLTALQSLEARLIRRVSLPWGVSLVAVARKNKV
ncbi:MAG: methylase [Armatimonadota bacterium]